jgi:hypothetical protein
VDEPLAEDADLPPAAEAIDHESPDGSIVSDSVDVPAAPPDGARDELTAADSPPELGSDSDSDAECGAPAPPTIAPSVVIFRTDSARDGASAVLLTRIDNAEDQTHAVTPPPPPASPRRRPGASAVAAQFLAQRPVACMEPATLAGAVCELQDRLDAAMAGSRFRDSKRAFEAAEAARSQMVASLKLQHQAEFRAELAAKREQSEADHADFTREMEDRERALDDALLRSGACLTARHLRTQREHDAAWGTEPIMRHYNRASQSIRILRVQQQYLLAAKHFDEAEEVCAIADRQNGAETVEKQYQRYVAYADSRRRLDNRQADEEDTIRKGGDVRRVRLAGEREKRDRRFTKRFRNLEIEDERAQDPERLWAICHRNDGDYVATLNGGARISATKIDKRAKVELFNTLPLPPLPPAHAPRGARPRGARARF